MSSLRTAAALVIGNELLTGKVRDRNVTALARLLFELGIALRRVLFCRDEVAAIAADVVSLRTEHDYVFTSGGVGPTHDDVTMAGIAQAFDRPLEPSALIEDLLRRYLGDRFNDGHRRMAFLPQGAEMVWGTEARWPTVRIENVFVLPGLPEVFLRKLAVLKEHLDRGEPFVSRSLETSQDEGELAPLLDRLCRDHPEVAIGSYPRWNDDGPASVAVTFDGRDPHAVGQAIAAFEAALPSESLIAARPEPPEVHQP